MPGVALHHRATLCLQRDNKRHPNQIYIKKGSRFISTSIAQAGTPHPYLGQNLGTHTHAQKLLPRYHEKQLLYNIRSNERITSSEPHRTVHTNYSNRAVLQHTSNGGAHICEPEQPYKLYILSCHYIQLQMFMFSILSRRCPLLATFCPSFFCLLSMLISDSRFDLVWFRLSCDHGWIRSGSVNVRKQQQQQCTWKMMHTTLLGRMPIHVRLCIKKNQNAPIPSEHPPVRRKNVKTFRWDQRLQIQK